MESPIDILSPKAREILSLNPTAYQSLVVRGAGNERAKELLDQLSPKDVFSAGASKSDELRDATLAGLWLFHDWLDESHMLSQSNHSATGSFWHAIMHRREGDFSNSKYWYARTSGQPALQTLGAQAGSIIHQAPADKSLLRIIASGWNPGAFVDLVESVHIDEADSRHSLAVRLQQLEWNALFDFCTRQ